MPGSRAAGFAPRRGFAAGLRLVLRERVGPRRRVFVAGIPER
jgi:hypothetical protein